MLDSRRVCRCDRFLGARQFCVVLDSVFILIRLLALGFLLGLGHTVLVVSRTVARLRILPEDGLFEAGESHSGGMAVSDRIWQDGVAGDSVPVNVFQALLFQYCK